jgi:hypothetical protein
MAIQEQLVGQSGATTFGQNLAAWLKSTATWIGVWIDTRADAWAAAALYDELRRLSDAELRSRGMTRDTIASHVLKSFD